MSRLDLVIFGATGVTGGHAAREAVRLGRTTQFTWAVAGRSRRKLDETLAAVGRDTGEDLSSTEVLLADLRDEASLLALCARATVLVNCCGPYQRGGERVVRACLAAGAHYVDVTGEPQFMDSVQLRYSSLARDAGVYVVNACGFDSVPNDMGVMFLKQQFDGTLHSVKSYLSIGFPSKLYSKALIHGAVHYGTWASIVYSFANFNEMLKVRKSLYPDDDLAVGPQEKQSPLLHRIAGDWALRLPYPDESVVYRTQRALRDTANQHPVAFTAHFNAGSLASATLLLLATILVFIASKLRFTRYLLLRFPRVCTFGLVTRAEIRDDVMNGTTFEFRLLGRGWPRGADVETEAPEKTATVLVRGVNPGYGATVSALILSAITILKERDRMPKTGGVYTTGVAFQNTSLIQKLNENNLTFEIVKDEN